ncbi:MAG: peptide deformylase, partial [Gammaproteobacteria bacterium]|nr:peptide deformylase [Gammaproteobacteria bacterium]
MPETNILRIGHPILRQKSDLVTDITSEETKNIVQMMFDTMKAANGAGLAAPQIGYLSRIIVFGLEKNPRYPDAEPVPMTVLINPQYEVTDEEEEAAWEGCLSIPGMRG